MKTTFDLPDALVKEIKHRAIREGRKLKDAMAELLRKGLAADADDQSEVPPPVVRRDKKTGLPLIECKHAASAAEKLTPQRVADILLDQEAGWQRDAGR